MKRGDNLCAVENYMAFPKTKGREGCSIYPGKLANGDGKTIVEEGVRSSLQACADWCQERGNCDVWQFNMVDKQCLLKSPNDGFSCPATGCSDSKIVSGTSSCGIKQLRNYGIVITGGFNRGNSLVTTELFNPLTGKTCSIKDLPVGRYYHTLDQLEDGSLVACGGQGDSISTYKTCVRFEGSAPLGEWTDYSTLVYMRYYHTSFVYQGKILLMGGGGSYKTTELVGEGEKYNLQQDTVHACGINDGSSVIVTGGYGSGIGHLKTVSRYNLEGFMENMPSLITARNGHGCGSFTNEDNIKVYVVAGGYEGSTPYLRSTELLSATASAWEAGQDLPDRGLASMASVSLDKAVVILGGYCFKDCPSGQEYRREIISFNGTWKKIGSLTGGRSSAAASLFTVPEEMECD